MKMTNTRLNLYLVQQLDYSLNLTDNKNPRITDKTDKGHYSCNRWKCCRAEYINQFVISTLEQPNKTKFKETAVNPCI